MRVVRNRPGAVLLARHAPAVVTVGNFDGMHRGHQALVQRAQSHAGRDRPVAVVTFEPLPQAFFRPDQPPARLSTVYQKLSLLGELGVDLVWMMRFDADLAELEPGQFVERVLVKTLAASQVVIGEDFRFGHQRAGDVALLRQLGAAHGFGVDALAGVEIDGLRVSSTRIRTLLADGNFVAAARLLGRPFRMEGRVVPGQRLGRGLGYATANLNVRAGSSPVNGIFATYARIERGGWLPAVSSLGRRPTFGEGRTLLETHIFDFDDQLYGRRLEVQFVAKLRDEWRFESIEELVVQMRQDEVQARSILAHAQ